MGFYNLSTREKIVARAYHEIATNPEESAKYGLLLPTRTVDGIHLELWKNKKLRIRDSWSSDKNELEAAIAQLPADMSDELKERYIAAWERDMSRSAERQ